MKAIENPCGCDLVPMDCCGEVTDRPLTVNVNSPGMPEWDGQSWSLVLDAASGMWSGSHSVECEWEPTCLYPDGTSTGEFVAYCDEGHEAALGWRLQGGIDTFFNEVGFDLVCDPFSMKTGSGVFASGCPVCEDPPPGQWYVEIT